MIPLRRVMHPEIPGPQHVDFGIAMTAARASSVAFM
jgi:hypothetical protein